MLQLTILALLLIITTTYVIIIQKNNTKIHLEQQKLENCLTSASKAYHSYCLEQDQEIRKFWHDINEHLYCITYLAQKSNNKELNTYLESINHTFTTLTKRPGIQTGSELITLILYQLTEQYKAQKITLSWHGQIPNTLITPKDLCSLFSNLLKNAFEATTQCQNKTIKVNIQTEASSLLISISNTCPHPPKTKNTTLITTKSTPKKHGYGTQIIQDIAQKYNAQINHHYNSPLFTIELTFLNILPPQY